MNVGLCPTAVAARCYLPLPLRLYSTTSKSATQPLSSRRDPHIHRPVTSSSPTRRIIIACDGTLLSSTRGSPSVSSNVSRFLRALNPIDPSTNTTQISLYQSGIGTGSLPSFLLHPLSGGTGIGLDDRVLDAYMFIANNHLPGDEISLFGFSRGAYAVRVLAGLIHNLGLYKKDWLWEIKRAYNAYKSGPYIFAQYVKDSRKWERRGRTRHVKIKCLGCWDTVGSMGLPVYWNWYKKLGFNKTFEIYDPKLTMGVENAFHALSIDECRKPFAPTLFHLPYNNETGEPDTKINLKQVWFPGVHANVGGGYADQNLADLTLAWMMDRCSPFLSFNESYIDMCVRLNHHPKYIKSKLRESHGFDKEYPGWARGRVYSNASGLSGWIMGKECRVPGGYYGNEVEQGGKAKVTAEYIHPSVRERWENDEGWRPDGMEGFKMEQKDGGWHWINGDVTIPEEKFTHDKKSFEWKLRYGRTT